MAWDKSTCNAAAEGGHLEVLKYAREKGCRWDAERIYNIAMRTGNIEMIDNRFIILLDYTIVVVFLLHLGSFLCLSGSFLSSLSSKADELLVGSFYSQLGVGTEALHLVGDGDHLELWGLLGERHDSSTHKLSRGSTLISRAVTLLRLTGLLREQHELALILLQSLDVVLERFQTLILPSVVDSDSNSWGNLNRDTSFLQLLEGEPLSESRLGVVTNRLGAYLWAQRSRNRPWESGGSLSSTS